MHKHDLIKYINDNEISLNLHRSHTKINQVDNKGHGRFAGCDIAKDEIIMWVGSIWLKHNEKEKYTEDYFQYVEGAWAFQGGLKYYLNGCINHSCDPNCYVQENIIKTIKDVKEGEELTLDYGAFIYHGAKILDNCKCGSDMCRGTITGKDWKLHNLVEKYHYKVNGVILRMWLQDQQS